jgi:hypothetical protein
MQSLIKDMMELWKGVDTYDACIQDEFKLHTVFLWSIQVCPRYPTIYLDVEPDAFMLVCSVLKFLATSL